MAKTRKKRPSPPPEPNDPLLQQVDQFLEDGVEGLNAADRRRLAEESGQAPEEIPAVAEDADDEPLEEPAAAEQGGLELVLEEDGLQAVIRTVYPDTSVADIADLLERHEVVVGLAQAAIQHAVSTAQEVDAPVHDVVVARGTPPKPPPAPRIEYQPPEGLDRMPVLDAMAKLLGSSERRELDGAVASLQAWAAKPGDRLALRQVPDGTPGESVQGQPIPPPPAEPEDTADPRLQPGANVELAPNGTDYVASAWGYAGTLGGQVAVLSPVWVAADAMEACFFSVPPVTDSTPPSADDLRQAFSAAGVSHGVDEAAVASICADLAQGKRRAGLVALALGTPARPPKDALPKFSFQYESQAGRVRHDGSIDFKERNMFPSVAEDALLVECEPAAEGEPGTNVRGEEVPCGAPVSAVMIPGENVRLEQQDGAQRLIAATAGGASVQRIELRDQDGTVTSREYTVSVQPVAQISGDVGYDTGNIDFQGHVAISGSVAGGFSVKATGDVVVSGSIEPGAVVEAGGGVTIQQGILGRETRVTAESSVTARFVNEATVHAGADVVIGSYVHGARVQAGRRVQVEGAGGSGSSGGIVGGQVWAVEGMTSRNLGSERSTNTRIFVGIAPEGHARLETLRKTIRQADIMIEKLLATIGLPALRAEDIRDLVARHQGRKKIILHYVKKANQLAQIRAQHTDEQRSLLAEIAQAASKAWVEVHEVAHARVLVQLGNRQLVVPQSIKGVRFSLDPGEDPPVVRQTPVGEE